MGIMEQPEALLTAIIFGYFLGSIPFGLVLTRLAGFGDIRQIGSGNIGATNVLRTGNKPLAFLTLVLDSGKGGAAVLLVPLFGLDPVFSLIAGTCAVIGHNFPIWLKFKGGKGVATTIGTLLFAAWPVCLAVCLTWLATAAIMRISSLAGIVSLGLSPVYAWYLIETPWNQPLAIMAGFLGALAIIRHHANISRILRGEEPKIGKKKETSG